jgi:hypothetical protein
MRVNALTSARRRRLRSRARHHLTAATLGLTVVGAGVALAVALGRNAVHQWSVVGRPGATPDEALALLAAGTALALILWLALSTAAVLLSHVPGQCGLMAARVADAWAPSVSRRLAGALLGVATVGALAPGVASAASPAALISVAATSVAETGRGAAAGAPGGLVNGDGPGFGTTVPLASAEVPAPGWLPIRPVARADAKPDLLTSVPRPEPDQVVVRRGDTLWDLARRDLGPDATDAEVAQSWPRWHAANRRVIGPDPGRLRPGQILRRPGPDLLRGNTTPTTPGARR